MDYTTVILIYLVFFISSFLVYNVFRKESKGLLYLVCFIYLAVGALFTFLLVDEIASPSVGANIGLGFSMLLVVLLSFLGILASAVILLVRKLRNRSPQ